MEESQTRLDDEDEVDNDVWEESKRDNKRDKVANVRDRFQCLGNDQLLSMEERKSLDRLSQRQWKLSEEQREPSGVFPLGFPALCFDSL